MGERCFTLPVQGNLFNGITTRKGIAEMSNQEHESDNPGTDELDGDLELDTESSEAVTGGLKERRPPAPTKL
jgi:hypothetical protein